MCIRDRSTWGRNNRKAAFLEAEILKQVLTKVPEERDEKDMKLLASCTENCQFFIDIGKEVHMKLLRVMTYEQMEKDEIVFREGDSGTKFYVLLKGTVRILVPAAKLSLANGARPDSLIEVRRLTSGDSFGELALISSQPRAATIQCLEQCHLGVLGKAEYKAILKKAQEDELDAKISALAALKIFSGFASNLLKKIYLNGVPDRMYRMNQGVYGEREKAERMYIILDGEFKLLKAIRESPPEIDDNPMMRGKKLENRVVEVIECEGKCKWRAAGDPGEGRDIWRR
eukprot:TRINITY_DN6902_c0_g1_i4.p1 TRINITY_DN6902_c0_g1~~TRINITY_DN6902_c0_g1_i4.p1  ORF type:complete len:286 (+),score=73.20 TRINITY_DN6902_c0_g1_i4:65-922(+)